MPLDMLVRAALIGLLVSVVVVVAIVVWGGPPLISN